MSRRPKKDGVYRIVHISNIRQVLEKGMFAANHPRASDTYRLIGNGRLTKQRRQHPAKPPATGVLGDYIPFYFGRHSIMLYQIHTGHGSVVKSTQDAIVYLLCSIDSLEAAGCTYYFTDGHAKNNHTRFFSNRTDLEKLDWEVITDKYWSNTEEDRDRQRRKQAELLVKSHVPVDCIDAIVVKTAAARAKIQEILVHLKLSINCVVKADGSFYY